MKRSNFRVLFLLLPGLLLLSFVWSDLNELKSVNHLFKIERSRDADEVYYDLNLRPDGKPDPEKPVDIYWVKHTEQGKIEPLTNVQRKLGYGINITKVSMKGFEFRFVSFSDKTFMLKELENHVFKVVTSIKDQEAELQKIYINFEGDSFWFPKITRVDLYGIDLTNGKLLVEEIPQ